MNAPTKNPAKRSNADGAVNAESLQGNHHMSLSSSARSEQIPYKKTMPVDPDQAAGHAFFLANALNALFEAMPEGRDDGPRVAAKSMVLGLADIAEQLALALGGFGGTLINGVKGTEQ